MRIISDFSERYFCHFYHFFSKKVVPQVLHNLFQCGKSGSQFCHFYQSKVRKKSETVGEVVKVAKITSKKVAPYLYYFHFRDISSLICKHLVTNVRFCNVDTGVQYDLTAKV